MCKQGKSREAENQNNVGKRSSRKKEKANKKVQKERKSYRLTERRIEWIYFLASDIPYILPSCPAVGAPVGLHLPNQAPAPFVCVWMGQAEEGA